MIEHRLLSRRTLATRWIAAARRSRWQRWADALAGRWGRAPGSSPLGLAFARSQHAAAPLVILQNRVDISVALAAAFQLAVRRSTVLAPAPMHIDRRQLSLVRLLLRGPRAERAELAALRQATVVPVSRVWERSLQRLLETRLERQLATRVTAHAVLLRARTSEVVLQTRLVRRAAPPVDVLPKRLLSRSVRQAPEDPSVVPTRLAAAPRPAPPSIERATEVLAGPAARSFMARDAGRHELVREPPPLNIERIAEQVIDRLDRRIVAQRERMGRV